MTNHPHPVATASAADLRLLAFLLARTLRAIRSDRLERGAELILKTLDVLIRLPECEQVARANQLLEHIAIVGEARATALRAARAKQAPTQLRAVR
jgi:hypothetical protein